MGGQIWRDRHTVSVLQESWHTRTHTLGHVYSLNHAEAKTVRALIINYNQIHQKLTSCTELFSNGLCPSDHISYISIP